MPSSGSIQHIVQKKSFLVALLFLLAVLIPPISALDLSTDNPPPAVPSTSQGDSVFIHGTATGHPQQGLNIWIISTNYVTVTNIGANDDNSFEYELTGSDTQDLAPGQYFVLVQHPMMNGEFDITYNAGTGDVINEQLGAGTVIFQLTGAGSLQGPAAASALVQAVADQNVDDTFTTVSFSIGLPEILVDPIPDYNIGDQFTISGTTNLAAGDNLLVEIYSSSFDPTTKEQSGEFSGANGIVQVMQGGGGLNRWSFGVDASAFKLDEYIITVSAVQQEATGSTTFQIVEYNPVTPATPTDEMTPEIAETDPGTTILLTTTPPLPSATPTDEMTAEIAETSPAATIPPTTTPPLTPATQTDEMTAEIAVQSPGTTPFVTTTPPLPTMTKAAVSLPEILAGLGVAAVFWRSCNKK